MTNADSEGDRASGPVDPTMERMAADLAEIRRKQSIEFYAPGIALLILIFLVWWFLHQ
jgi:hypothetical protein